MSDQAKYLLIDIGNSRIKYALVSEGQEDLAVLHCVHTTELTQIIKQVAKVLVASVGKTLLVEELQSLCQQHKVECQLIHTQAQQFGIHCAYEQFTTMGVDRWLAILAARKITLLPVAIVDLGTANTCDIVIENQHIGGWIAPGFNLMKQGLLANTQKVFADNNVSHHLSLGVSTPECVNLGCLAAVQGLVLMAESTLAKYATSYEILITGGDQNLITDLKQPYLHYFPNLVLLGLMRFI
ncbi:type III pantothenate kinase [Paraglaciecola hydrolytica]|uniref:Type III pantothenate kinase n=1 Tax=Paraglaciecola hydrolytica TaxID=1799789 RepID=A0A148KMM2_9ALTE|nr:type III pantothenate kinase [Paraglaciecola hydrolytica]KXI27540.1 type III pantothenate kinase [Paraglaciecola hydrolytica]